MSLVKQTDEPLYPDIVWNQPVNKRAGGHILIMGGHSRQFIRTQTVYKEAHQAGAGKITVVLPRPLQKVIGSLPDCMFVAHTPAGSFSRQAEQEIYRYISEVDSVLLPGELSQNTETVGLLETLLNGMAKPSIITDEIIRALLHTPETIQHADVLIATPQTLSELARTLHIPVYVKTPDLQKEQRLLNAINEQLDSHIVCYGHEHILVGGQDRISMTPVDEHSPERLMAYAAVFFTQHTQKFEALTTAAWRLQHGDEPE